MVFRDDREVFEEHRTNKPVPGAIHDIECRIISKAGTKRWIRHFCQPVFTASGKFLGIRASNIDIDKRKNAEIRLQKSEALLRSVYETAGVGMALLDPNANFLKVNPSFCEMVGYSEEELLTGGITVTHPDDLQESEVLLQQLREGQLQKHVMEKRYLRKDGRTIQIQHHASIIHDILGFPYLFVIQAHDVTALKEATRKAEESDLLKTSFLHNLSHEIRTPANAIQGFSELLKQPDLTIAEKEEFIGILHQSVRHLIDILNDTVEISKLETNQVSISNAPVDLNRLMRNVYHECRQKYTHAIGQLDDFLLELQPGLDVHLVADELRIGQILTCLLSNAFKFTSSGKVTFGYMVDQPGQVTFFVKDTGIGIPPDKQSVIFEKFRQGENTTTRIYGGLGIGLTIAQGLVKVMDGKIWLTSAEGKGSTFYFSIPMAPKTKDHAAPVIRKPKPKIGNYEGKTILVAEDIDANFDFLRIALLRTNATILRARSGAEAIRICRGNPSVDLVLMDIQMPEMNGYEATREIKKFRPDLPVVAQTAYSLDFNKDEAFLSGCDAYLSKPIGLQELFSTIEELFAARNP